jgi:hypothetical protein
MWSYLRRPWWHQIEIYIALSKVIPEAASYKEKDLSADTERHGTFLRKVRENMEANPMPNWTVHDVEVK